MNNNNIFENKLFSPNNQFNKNIQNNYYIVQKEYSYGNNKSNATLLNSQIDKRFHNYFLKEEGKLIPSSVSTNKSTKSNNDDFANKFNNDVYFK